MIWKRIFISLFSVLIPVGFLVGGLFIVQGVSGGGCAGMVFIPHLMLAVLAGLFLGGMLSGFCQPPSTTPWKNSLLFSPGIWFSLWMMTRPDIHNGFAAGAFVQTSLWLIIPLGVSWGGCRLGMQIKRKTKGQGTEQATPPYSEAAARPPQG